MPTQRVINSSASEFCFTATCSGCVSTGPNSCCALLTGFVKKIVFGMKAGCQPAVKAFFKPVSLNGVPLGANVFVDDVGPGVSTGLRITNVNTNSSGLDGDVYCIKAAAPCNTFASLFMTNAQGFPLVS
jgi:hypothetical protein